MFPRKEVVNHVFIDLQTLLLIFTWNWEWSEVIFFFFHWTSPNIFSYMWFWYFEILLINSFLRSTETSSVCKESRVFRNKGFWRTGLKSVWGDSSEKFTRKRSPEQNLNGSGQHRFSQIPLRGGNYRFGLVHRKSFLR